MYQLDKTLNLVTIATPIDNNLALLDVDENVCADTLAVINGCYVNVIPILNPLKRAKYVSAGLGERRGKERVTEIKWLRVNDESIFVVLSTIGLQIYDSEVCDLRFHHACQDSCSANSYTKGACVIKNSILCVGTYVGTIWMFKCNDDNTNYTLIDRFFAHDEAIVCLDGFGTYLVSTSEEMTYVWTAYDDMRVSFSLNIPGLLSKPTTLKICGIHCVIGYESGELCLFEMLDENVYVRIVGHRLKVTAIDITPIRHMILTVSADAYLKIWQYKHNVSQINCLYSMYNEDGPLCGAMFTNLSATEFCTVTAYDLAVRFYQRLLDDGENDRDEVDIKKSESEFKW